MKKRPKIIRSMPMAPETLDEATRSVGIVIATETPCEAVRWNEDGSPRNVMEVLLMRGCVVPTESLPFLDNHNWGDSKAYIGSAADFAVDPGEFSGRAYFATTTEGERCWTLVKGGHWRGISFAADILEEEERDGVVYVTKWQPTEVSLATVPKDKKATIRSRSKERPMQYERDEEGNLVLDADGNPIPITSEEGSERGEGEDGGEELTAREAGGTDEDMTNRGDGGKPAGTVKKGATKAPVARSVVDPITAERDRSFTIRSLAQAHGVDARVVDVWLNDGWSVAEVRGKLGNRLAKRSAPIPGVGGQQMQRGTSGNPVTAGRSHEDNFEQCAVDAILRRAGVLKPDQACRGHEALLGKTLLELAVMDAARFGVKPRGYGNDALLRSLSAARGQRKTIIVRGTETTANFGSVFLNALNVAMGLRFVESEATWKKMVGYNQTLNNTQPAPIVKMSGFSSLSLMSENGKVPEGSYGEDKHEYAYPQVFGALFNLTDEMLLNDNVGAFNSRSAGFSQSALRTVNQYFWYKWLANSVLNEDNKAVFHTDHGNITATAAQTPTTAGAIDLGVEAMRLRKDPGGNVLNLRPKLLVVPPAYESQAKTLVASQWVPGGTNETANIHQGQFEIVSEAILQLGVTIKREGVGKKALTAAGSARKWWLAASPTEMENIVVGFLGGETPRVREDKPIGFLGTVSEVTLRFSADWADHRGVHQYTNPAT
jgi:hypothetical protein